MIYPPIKKLMENMDSRYTLVIATSKRARIISDQQLLDISLGLKSPKGRNEKPVCMAVQEIYEGKINFKRNNL